LTTFQGCLTDNRGRTEGGKTAKVSQQDARNGLCPNFILGSAEHLVAMCYTSYTVNRSAPYLSLGQRGRCDL